MGHARCTFTCHISAPARSGQKYFTVFSNIYAKKKGIVNKFILTLRAIMISHEVDLVAGDFNGTVDEIAAVKTSVLLTKHLWTVSCLRHRAPHHCGDQVPFRTVGQTSADFTNHLALNVLESEQTWYIFHQAEIFCLTSHRSKLPSRNVASFGFVDWSDTWSKQYAYEPRISLKERPAECACGNPKRRIREIMGGRSLSS